MSSPASERATQAIPVEVGMPGRSEQRYFLPGAGKGEQFQDCDAGPEMVVVPAGSFIMGAPEAESDRFSAEREAPQHKVTIAQPFAVGRHAVTRGQFAAFVNETGFKIEPGADVWKHDPARDHWDYDPNGSWRDPGFAQDGSHPVVCINWSDAKAYAAWLSDRTGKFYRLLTEAEREYVTRAGTTTPFWWGSAITPAQANYNGEYVYEGGGSKGEYRKGTVSVATFAANPWGLHNVHGNVREWCEDVWHDTYEGAPSDGSAWLQGGHRDMHVVRSGHWSSWPTELRSAERGGCEYDRRGCWTGFRVVRGLSL